MIIASIILILTVISLTAQNAFAYLDPASGSMILQGILAAIAAIGVSIGVFWQRIKALFLLKKKTEDIDES
ncbi:hypothetical protein C4565_05580 [Candidatus Parcubacteria bacterium]|nr:MAG: hypothetical protein C4565_05580 [Candidatus Parcubacteria bacterium]